MEFKIRKDIEELWNKNRMINSTQDLIRFNKEMITQYVLDFKLKLKSITDKKIYDLEHYNINAINKVFEPRNPEYCVAFYDLIDKMARMYKLEKSDQIHFLSQKDFELNIELCSPYAMFLNYFKIVSPENQNPNWIRYIQKLLILDDGKIYEIHKHGLKPIAPIDIWTTFLDQHE